MEVVLHVQGIEPQMPATYGRSSRLCNTIPRREAAYSIQALGDAVYIHPYDLPKARISWDANHNLETLQHRPFIPTARPHLNHHPLTLQHLSVEENAGEYERGAQSEERPPLMDVAVDDADVQPAREQRQRKALQPVPLVLKVLEEVGPHLEKVVHDFGLPTKRSSGGGA